MRPVPVVPNRQILEVGHCRQSWNDKFSTSTSARSPEDDARRTEDPEGIAVEYDPTGSVIATNVVHVRRLTSGLLVAVRDIPITSGASAFAVADLDGDGKGDLAVARPGATSIDLYTTAEHGTVQYSGQITLEAPTAITAADVDGDGRADLVVGHSLGGQAAMTIMRQQCVPI